MTKSDPLQTIGGDTNHLSPSITPMAQSSTFTALIQTPSPRSPGATTVPLMSIGLISLIVLASLCAILGAIYAYIYYTRINPRSARARKYLEGHGQDEEGKVTHTHLLLFRKS